MMDERYRDELNQIRLTKESREDLARALVARQEQPVQRARRRWSRTAVAAAVISIAVSVAHPARKEATANAAPQES